MVKVFFNERVHCTINILKGCNKDIENKLNNYYWSFLDVELLEISIFSHFCFKI